MDVVALTPTAVETAPITLVQKNHQHWTVGQTTKIGQTLTKGNYKRSVSTRGEDGRGTCPVLSSIAPRPGRSSPHSRGRPSHSRAFSRKPLTSARASLPPPRANACNDIVGEARRNRRKRHCQLLASLDTTTKVANTSAAICLEITRYAPKFPR